MPQESIRILYVDDGSDHLKQVEIHLEDIDPDLDVESVRSTEALELVRQGFYDCVLACDRIASMDGVAFTRRVRGFSDVPVILYAEQGGGDVAEAAFVAGVDGYVRKEGDPGHYRMLADMIRRVVEHHRLDELHRAVVEGTRDAFSILIGTTTVYCNQFMADLVGVESPEELMGKDALIWVVEEDRERVRDIALGRQRGEERPLVHEFTIQRADGELRVIESSVSAINYRGRRASLSFNRDITERKRVEEELRVGERLASVVRMASMIGHDLRSPLVTIRNAAGLIERHPERAADWVRMIEENTDRAVAMLDELRNRTRQQPTLILATDLAGLIEATLEETPLPEGFQVSLSLGEGLGEVPLDPEKMRRVLGNLFWNARDAMPEGGVLKVGARVVGDGVEITVSDTGVGVPGSELGNLFHPFYTTKAKGMGLGLSFCKQAVEDHEGSISVESVEGVGTRFTIVLPLK